MNRTVFDRLTSDEDSNVFVLMTGVVNSPDYAEGTYNVYQTAIYVYPYSPALDFGRTAVSSAPPPGSLNMVNPTTTNASLCSSKGGACQSWAFSPAIAASGGTLYTGWVETGSQFDTSNCGVSHHPYVRSTPNTGTWTSLPGGGQTAACNAIDPENSSGSDASNIRLAVVNGTLWETHEKSSSFNSNMPSTAWARYWNGTTWTGGQIGCFSGSCAGSSSGIQQYPADLIASGATPTVALIEENNTVFVREYYLRVAQFDSSSSSWKPVGGKLNINTAAGTRVLFASIANNRGEPGCLLVEVANSSRNGALLTRRRYSVRSGTAPRGLVSARRH